VSRFTKRNEQYEIAWGADHVTGSFCQVWHLPSQDDEPAISIDNMGLVQGKCAAVPHAVAVLLRQVEARFAQARARGIANPNIDHETVTRLFELLGFKDIAREVFAAFD
jgi:hypothetical protein